MTLISYFNRILIVFCQYFAILSTINKKIIIIIIIIVIIIIIIITIIIIIIIIIHLTMKITQDKSITQEIQCLYLGIVLSKM